MNSEEVLKFD